jgi:methionyl-tRNA formyltransferase
MRIIMFGTGPFAVPTFKSLIESPHDVLTLVTRPILDSGKRRKSSENPSRDVAQQKGIPILEPPSCNDGEFVHHLASLEADLFVVCDYGQILSKACLGTSRLGGINLHGSLLPKYRGAAPIAWAIYHGEHETGVTIIHMIPRLDAGPCLVQASIPINPQDTTETMEPRLAELGVRPVHESIEMLQQWDGQSELGQRQDPQLATRAPRLKKADGLIDWTRTAVEISNQIRAFQPWPGSFTHWNADPTKPPMRWILLEANPVQADDLEHETQTCPAGGIAFCRKNRLWVQTGEGILSIDRIQPAGKRGMLIGEFLRGRQPKSGDQLS